MPVISRRIPAAVHNRPVTPFKIIVPRELPTDVALEVYKELKAYDTSIKLHDPYFIPDISSVFIGNYFGSKARDKDLSGVVKKVQKLQDRFPEALADTFVEYDVPEGLEDPVEFEATEVNPALGLPPTE